MKKYVIAFLIWVMIIRPLREFCVSDFRQNQEYHIINVHGGGLIPLGYISPGRLGRYARRMWRECRLSLPGSLFQGDQPAFRSANMSSS